MNPDTRVHLDAARDHVWDLAARLPITTAADLPAHLAAWARLAGAVERLTLPDPALEQALTRLAATTADLTGQHDLDAAAAAFSAIDPASLRLRDRAAVDAEVRTITAAAASLTVDTARRSDDAPLEETIALTVVASRTPEQKPSPRLRRRASTATAAGDAPRITRDDPPRRTPPAAGPHL